LVAQAGVTARAASVVETAASAEVVLLATPWPATKDILAGAGDLYKKIVIDATNPLLPDLSALEIGTTTSAAEQIASWIPKARVVKAFNTIGYPVMADPVVNGKAVTLFYCGDDDQAKNTTAKLAADLGFNPVDAGRLTQARLLEPMALLWISLAFKQGFGRHWGFTLLR
jgi:8-hydroxy-5-deazaflavin:NADPH oxidoreductase